MNATTTFATSATWTPTPLVEARGLTKHFKGFDLQGIDLTVEPGQILGFIGQNGSGKSTTIKALLGLISRDGGTAAVLGTPAEKLTHGSAAVKEQIGVVFDAISMPSHLHVGEVGKLMRRAYRSWNQTAYEGYLRSFGLTDPKKTVKDLSRGMGMKLSLACALSHGARLLILDEATAGLDPMARDEVLDILRDFVSAEDAAGNPVNGILMSSHITSDLDKIADTILCIDAGRPVFQMAKDEITDIMGVARCRERDVERVLASGVLSDGPVRTLRHEYGIDLLVSDRFVFAESFPDIPCDRMTIDDYMALMLKGERVHGGAAVHPVSSTAQPAHFAKGGDR